MTDKDQEIQKLRDENNRLRNRIRDAYAELQDQAKTAMPSLMAVRNTLNILRPALY